jgi:hypothetical protein
VSSVIHDPDPMNDEAVDRLAEVTAALIALGESPEVARIAAEELEKLWLGVPMDEERLDGALETSLAERPEDDPEHAEMVAKGLRALADAEERLRNGQTAGPDDVLGQHADLLVKLHAGQLTLGELIPSDEQLNADPDLDAWFAGIPGAPPPRRIRASSSPAPKVAGLAASRVQVRPREGRPRRRRVASAARSPGRPSADDDDDPVGRRRREAVVA